MLTPRQEVNKAEHSILCPMSAHHKAFSFSKLSSFCGLLVVFLAVFLSLGTEVQAKVLTIDRTYTVTTVDVPKQCELDNFKTTCARLVNLYARRFEREMVLYKNNQYDFDNLDFNLNDSQPRATQKVKMSVYTSKEEDPVFTLFTLIEQTMPGQKTSLLVETINFDTQTGQRIDFQQMFKKPELAAMLCARKIQANYKDLDSPLLPVVISATELSPRNYMITPFGLRFFFAPGLVDYNSKQADSLLVSLEDLAAAQPIAKWWEDKDQTITDAQRQALANSKLSGVIKLEDPPKASNKTELAQERPQDKGKFKSSPPIIKGTASNTAPVYPKR